MYVVVLERPYYRLLSGSCFVSGLFGLLPDEAASWLHSQAPSEVTLELLIRAVAGIWLRTGSGPSGDLRIDLRVEPNAP